MKRKWWIVGMAVLAVALVIGGTVWAAEVTSPTRRLQENFVRGTVTAVDDGQVSVSTAEGERATLLVGDSTYLWVPGEPPTTTVELKVGDPVLAAGEAVPDETGERTIAARLVVVVSDEDLPRFAILGRTVAVTRQTIVVQTGRGERAMTVMPQTRIWSRGERRDSLREVVAGDPIIALGQPTELGQWRAGLIFVPGSQPLARRGLRGQVSDADAQAGTLTIETAQRGQITVVTTEDTRYRIPGIEQPGFQDIEIGDQVVILGRFDEDEPAAFLARVVSVFQPESRSGES